MVRAPMCWCTRTPMWGPGGAAGGVPRGALQRRAPISRLQAGGVRVRAGARAPHGGRPSCEPPPPALPAAPPRSSAARSCPRASCAASLRATSSGPTFSRWLGGGGRRGVRASVDTQACPRHPLLRAPAAPSSRAGRRAGRQGRRRGCSAERSAAARACLNTSSPQPTRIRPPPPCPLTPLPAEPPANISACHPQHAGFRIVVPSVDASQYDLASASAEAPLYPFHELSCMDAPPPFVGERPCCSKQRRERCGGSGAGGGVSGRGRAGVDR